MWDYKERREIQRFPREKEEITALLITKDDSKAI